MRRCALYLVGLLLCAGAARAAEPQGKLVKDLWDAAYLEGAKVGYFRTTVHEIERDGQRLLRTALELNLTVKRFNALANVRMESGTEETPDGKVKGVFMRQFFDQGKQLVLAGSVVGDQLVVKVDGGRIERKIRWNDQVLGLQKQERFFAENRAKPGDRFSYQSFEPQLNAVVTLRAVVKEPEEVDVLRARKEGGKVQVDRLQEKLLRVEVTPDKIETPQGNIQLPGMVSWLDKEMLPVRSQMELPGLGPVTFYRTTREAATAPGGALPQVADLGLATLIPIKKEIRRPHETRAAVYRITVKGDEQVSTAFAEDDRQHVKKVEGSTVELHVRAQREPQKVEKPQEPKAEFLQSCYYLKSDDARVKELAAKAVGSEADPWKKAQRVERWVHHNMRINNSAAFAPADQVARDLQGDCRQHAMLTAAMCRAAGMPSRTAVGLVYVQDRQRGPVFGFHMWAEVWVRGQWLAVDATLGQGSIGAAHIKIADSSWHGIESLTPLLPVARVLGKLSVEVVSVE